MPKLTLTILEQNLKTWNNHGTFISDESGISDQWVKDRLFNKLNSIKEKPELSQWLKDEEYIPEANNQPSNISLPQLSCHQKDLFLSLFSNYKTISGATTAHTARTAWPMTLLVLSELHYVTSVPSLPQQTMANTGDHKDPAACDQGGLWPKHGCTGSVILSLEPGTGI